MVVGAASIAGVVAVMIAAGQSVETWGSPDQRKSDGLLWQFNIATGSIALTLLVVSLSFSPAIVVLGRRRAPVHTPWRRVTGLWCAIAVAVHGPGGLAIHSTGWRVWTPFESVVPGVRGRALDEFTLGYWAGLFAVTLLAPLVITSRDRSLRRLGPNRWRRLHRVLTWTVYWLVAVHVVALQYGEARDRRHVALTAAVFATALGARVLWIVARRRVSPRTRPATT